MPFPSLLARCCCLWHLVSAASSTVPPFQRPVLHNSPKCLGINAPHDIAGAITLPLPQGGVIHHVWQFCPDGEPGDLRPNVGRAWVHSTSTDLVHWHQEDHDIGTYSGFVVRDDDGVVCAGQRCGNARNVSVPSDPCPGIVVNGTGLMNATAAFDVPLFLTCATDDSLSRWGPQTYPFNPHEYRIMAYDPQAWKDDDGYWYIGVATDACNLTTRRLPCAAGYKFEMWRSPRLRGRGAEWVFAGDMITTSDSMMDRGRARNEMVTPSFTGNLPGDPRGGATRLLTNNVCEGTTYWLGVQANGSRLQDGRGSALFDAPGEMGMMDWGAITVNRSAVAAGRRGVDALMVTFPGSGCHAPYSMMRTFGDPSGQTVATRGRKVAVAWVGEGFSRIGAAQSLPRDLSLDAEGVLLHAWVPELKRLRSGDALAQGEPSGMQIEVLARFTVADAHAVAPVFGVAVLGLPGTHEETRVGVDLGAGVVFIDGSQQGACAAWGMPAGCVAGLRAGPLLGSAADVSIHCYVDHSLVSCIFNNMTAITAVVAPSSQEAGGSGVTTFGLDARRGITAKVTAWRLEPGGPPAGRDDSIVYV